MDPGPSAALASLFSGYLRALAPGPTVGRLLAIVHEGEPQAVRLASVIELNPLYAHYLQRLDLLAERARQWRDETPEDRRTARVTLLIASLLGPEATRNAALSIWLSRGLGEFPKKPGLPFTVLPRARLRHALAAQEFCEGNAVTAAETALAFQAGLAFDWVELRMQLAGGNALAEKNYFEECWTDSLKSALRTHTKAQGLKILALSRYAFASRLLLGLGRSLMAISFPRNPSWKEFLKSCSKEPRLQPLLEKHRFPFTHCEAAALCASQNPLLRPAALAIRHAQDPCWVPRADRDSRLLAELLHSS